MKKETINMSNNKANTNKVKGVTLKKNNKYQAFVYMPILKKAITIGSAYGSLKEAVDARKQYIINLL